MPIISKETWEKFDPTEQKEIRELYSALIDAMKLEEVGSQRHIVLSGMQDRYISLFGKENLQPKPLSYEDVVRELFKNGAWQFGDGYMNEEYGYFDESANETYNLNMTSRKQAEKLLAINKLLNVAAYLNKKEDGTRWKPDFSDVNNEFYTLGIDPDDDSVRVIEVNMQRVPTEVVYFRTEELAKQAIQILGKDTVRLALTSDY